MNRIPQIKIFLASTLVLVISACGKQEANSTPSSVKAKKQESSSLFSCIPSDFPAIGRIDISKISQIKEVQKEVEENKSLPYYKELHDAGLEMANIDSVIFGLKPDITPQNFGRTKAVILIRAKNNISLAKIAELIERNNKTKLEKIKIQNMDGYILSDKQTNSSEKVTVFQLQNNVLGIVSKDMADKLIIGSTKGISVLNNAELMKLSDNARMKNMFWIAAVIPKELYKNAKADTPKIISGFVSLDYTKEILQIAGTIYCPDKENLQKIIQPLQLVSSFIVMNPAYGIKPEDISLKPNNNRLDINVKLTKTVLDNIARSQKQAKQVSDKQATGPQLDMAAEGLGYPDTEAAEKSSPLK